MIARLGELGEVRELNPAKDEPLHRQADLSEVWGLVWFGGRFTPECVAAAPRLRAVGGMTDNSGHGVPLAALAARGISFIDSTRAWSQSVAEVALGLALGALRQI